MHLTQGLHRAVQHSRNAVGLIYEDRHTTFEEIRDRVSRAAAGLQELGVRAGERVGILASNSDRYVEALLAVAWVGAVATPLNTRWSISEVLYALQDSGASTLLLGATWSPRCEEIVRALPELNRVVHLDDGCRDGVGWEDLVDRSEPIPDARTESDDLAGIFYTGGTTGSAKGVMLSHANIMCAALGSLASGNLLTAGGTLLTVAPLFHLAGIWPWAAQTAMGGPTALIAEFSPGAVIDAVRTHRITEMLLVPTMVQRLADELKSSSARLPSLRHLLYAGAPMPPSLVSAIHRVLPDVGMVQAYGMTELAPVATILGPADHDEHHVGSVGRAAPHAEVDILDVAERECARGEIGEIVVRGSHVMLGYWNKPELSATTLRGGAMHTGDLGYMDDDGYVYVVDRLKDMIVTGGENVYSVEVENALLLHPGVHMCAVVGLPDPRWGERVHAVVVPAAGEPLTLEGLREFCGRHIGRYKLLRSLDVVEALPVSSAGKVLKSEIRSWYSNESGKAATHEEGSGHRLTQEE